MSQLPAEMCNATGNLGQPGLPELLQNATVIQEKARGGPSSTAEEGPSSRATAGTIPHPLAETIVCAGRSSRTAFKPVLRILDPAAPRVAYLLWQTSAHHNSSVRPMNGSFA